MKTSLLLFLVTIMSAAAWAGKDVGNGGGAWVCREPSGGLRWIKLVDFFEAEKEFGLLVPEDSRPYVDQHEGVATKIDSSRADLIFKIAFKKHLRNVVRNIRWLPGAGIQKINDALYRVQPKPSSCAGGFVDYEQLANYTDYGSILIDQDLFSRLTPTQQAGLIVHEAVYAMYRERDDDQNSLKSRKLVGYLFSDQSVYQYDSLLKFENLDPSENFCGLCTIDFEAEWIGSFHDGIALVKKDGRYGYIDSKGVVVLPLIYDEATEMKGGVAYVELPTYRGFIDKQGHRLFLAPSRDFANWYRGFSNGVGVGGSVNALLVDLTGKPLFKAEDMYQPSEGLIAYTMENHRAGHDPKYGYLNDNGTVAIQPRFDDAAVFKNGVARVVENGIVSFIDKTGRSIDISSSDDISKGRRFLNQLSSQFKMKAWDWSTYFQAADVPYYFDPAFDSFSNRILTGEFKIDQKHESGSVIGDFNEGRAPVLIELPRRFGIPSYESLWAFIDTDGQFITEPIFEKIGPFSQGLAPVQESHGKFGFINSAGRYIIAPQFDEAYSFDEGYARVRIGKRWGYISREDVK